MNCICLKFCEKLYCCHFTENHHRYCLHWIWYYYTLLSPKKGEHNSQCLYWNFSQEQLVINWCWFCYRVTHGLHWRPTNKTIKLIFNVLFIQGVRGKMHLHNETYKVNHDILLLKAFKSLKDESDLSAVQEKLKEKDVEIEQLRVLNAKNRFELEEVKNEN